MVHPIVPDGRSKLACGPLFEQRRSPLRQLVSLRCGARWLNVGFSASGRQARARPQQPMVTATAK